MVEKEHWLSSEKYMIDLVRYWLGYIQPKEAADFVPHVPKPDRTAKHDQNTLR